MEIGFVGAGVMGSGMIRNLLKAGHSVRVATRTEAKAQPLFEAGATRAASPKEAAEQSDLVLTIVGYPRDVEEVYMGREGIFASKKKGLIAVDMTTSTPALAVEIAAKGEALGMRCMDAPVSGGDIGAKNGTLSIMCGGEASLFEDVRPIFQAMGQNIVLQGPAGAGQHAKMANQIAIASGMVAMCESIAYARAAGLDAETMLRSVAAGSAGSWSLTNYAPRILKGDYAPGFLIRHFVKDMGIALQEAARMDLDLPGLSLAHRLYAELLEEGYGDLGTQALMRAYDRAPGGGR